MLQPPVHFELFFEFGVFISIVAGAFLSFPSLVNHYSTVLHENQTENENPDEKLPTEDSAQQLTTSPSKHKIKEPFNAWASLVYLATGIGIFTIGLGDFLLYKDPDFAPNSLTADAMFTLMIGFALMSTGVTSFLHHCTLLPRVTEYNNIMHYSLAIPIVLFTLWDRSRPPAVSSYMMICIANTLSFSLFHGTLNYYALNISLGVGLFSCLMLETLFRYGGVVDEDQYLYIIKTVFSLLFGGFVYLVNYYKKSLGLKMFFLILFGISLCLCGTILGFTDFFYLFSCISWVLVFRNPDFSVSLKNFFVSFAVFFWWYMLRVRPGNPLSPTNTDTGSFCILLFILFKAAWRNIALSWLPMVFQNFYMGDRIRLVIEHVVFSLGAYYVLYVNILPSDSWVLDHFLYWVQPPIPSSELHLYFLLKVGNHVEEVLYLIFTGSVRSLDPIETFRRLQDPNRKKKNDLEMLLEAHHNLTALLCLSAYYSGYIKIGTVVMFLFDISEIPFHLYQFFAGKRWIYLKAATLLTIIPTWLYCRGWLYFNMILMPVLLQSKGFLDNANCEIGNCSWQQVPERIPFLIALLLLLSFSCVWLFRVVMKIKNSGLN